MASGFYEILGVSRTATDAEIKKAFKELAKKYHPDKHPEKSFYEEHFKKINEAYQVLSDKQRRAQYDFMQYHASTTYSHQPRPKTQKPPYTSAARPAGYQRPSASQQKKREEDREKKIKRYYLYTGMVIVMLCLSGYWFYNFMNDYSAGIYYKEGLLAEQNKQYQSAMENYLMCLSYNEHNPEVNEKIGDMYIQITDNYKKSIIYYTRAYGYFSEISDKKRVGLKKAKSYIKIRDGRSALRELAILQAIPDNSFNRDDSITYYQGDAYFAEEEFLEAQSMYEYFFRKHPKSSEALVKIAVCQYNQGDKDVAFSTLKKAEDRFPNRGESYYFKGQMYLLDNDTTNACIFFHKGDSMHVEMASEATEMYCK